MAILGQVWNFYLLKPVYIHSIKICYKLPAVWSPEGADGNEQQIFNL